MKFRKQVSFHFVFSLSVLLAFTAGASKSALAGKSIGVEDAGMQEGFSALSRQVVTGKVAFESRYTRVLEEVCDGAPCHQSQQYWSLVIQSGASKYILNEKLNVGMMREPAFADLAGVPVRPGTVVQLEGEVADNGLHQYSIQKVHHVQLVLDLGWACYNMGGGTSNVYARVWRDPETGASPEGRDSYRMRVQEVVNRTVRPIAYIQDAVLAVRSNQMVFAGASSAPQDVEVELQIADALPQSLTAPAKLKIKKRGPEGLARETGVESEAAVIEMNCSRTRTMLFLGEN